MKEQVLTNTGLSICVEEIKQYIAKNLSVHTLYTVPVLSSNWVLSGNSYINQLSVTGITSNDDVQIIPRDDWTDEQRMAYIDAEILSGSLSENIVTIRAVGIKPTIDFDVDVMVVSTNGQNL